LVVFGDASRWTTDAIFCDFCRLIFDTMTKPNVVFNFDTIELAFEYANISDGSHTAYLDRHTGKSLYFSTFGDSDEEPDDLDDASRYVAIPDKRELGLGSQLPKDFARDNAPSLADDIYEFFRGPGAYRRFEDLLDRNKLLESWYEYQAERERTAIEQWCSENDIRYTIDV
jgi:hypothetical protein